MRLMWRQVFSLIGGLGLVVARGPAAQAQAASPLAPPPLSTAAAPLVFRGVTVIDVQTGERHPNQMVIIVGSRIQTVAPAQTTPVPAGARVIDARGKYLIPGFWDMHAHCEFLGEFSGNLMDALAVKENKLAPQDSMYRWIYPRFIANGVTGIREMAQRWPTGADSFRVWQRAVLAGERIGPRAIGPSADLSWGNNLKIETPADAIRIIDSLKAAGDAFVKSHSTPDDRTIFLAILRESRRVGLPVVGHLPFALTNIEAADSGWRSIEHTSEHRQCWNWPEALTDSVALAERCAPVIAAYLRNGTWLTPTLAVHWVQWFGEGYSADLWPSVLLFWRTLHRLGVRNILAGSDWAQTSWTPVHGGYVGFQGSPARRVAPGDSALFWPGLSARDEVVLLADAGFTPLEALQAGTLNPARFLNATDSLGTVAPAKLADLVLLDGDPLADITNVLQLWGVVANGRYFDQATLAALDPEGHRPGVGLAATDRRARSAAGGAASRPAP